MSAWSVVSPDRRAGLRVLVAGTASDAHTWNLIFLQLHLTERGHRVVNAGPCVPDRLLVARCHATAPDLVVLSSVNGHGYTDGLRTVTHLRREPGLSALPVVIGGKLGTDGRRDPERAALLLAAGCTAVFDDGDLAAFDDLLATIAPHTARVAS